MSITEGSVILHRGLRDLRIISSQYISSCPTKLQSSTDLLNGASLRFLAMNREGGGNATVTLETRAALTITQTNVV
jgi:hypothetical protein